MILSCYLITNAIMNKAKFWQAAAITYPHHNLSVPVLFSIMLPKEEYFGRHFPNIDLQSGTRWSV